MTLGDFSDQAESYRKSRPTYPSTLIDLLMSDASIGPGDTVADFGAGTGIMTEALVERGFNVSAIEPNEAMRDRANVPAAKWISGSFEASHLETASQRWAVAAQAFHWADPQRSLPEIRRILRPKCLFTVLWNDRLDSDGGVVSWTQKAIRRHIPEFDEAYRIRRWDEILESTGDFEFLSRRTVRHSILMSRDRYLELWRSHNRLNTIAGPQRFSTFISDLTVFLENNQHNQIDVHYECTSWSARRIDSK